MRPRRSCRPAGVQQGPAAQASTALIAHSGARGWGVIGACVRVCMYVVVSEQDPAKGAQDSQEGSLSRLLPRLTL